MPGSLVTTDKTEGGKERNPIEMVLESVVIHRSKIRLVFLFAYFYWYYVHCTLDELKI